MKKSIKYFKIVLPYVAIILSAFLCSYSVRAFINKAGLLTGGVSGISLIISRYIGMWVYNLDSLSELLGDPNRMNLVNTLTSLLYFSFNIPLIVLAFRKLGKRFAILSTLYIVLNSLFIRLLPNEIMNVFDLGDNNAIAYALFAGVLNGCAIGLALNVGGSTGGMEIIGTYYSRKKQVSIGKFSSIVNACIITLGGIIFKEWTLILFTLVLVFVSGRVVDALHRFTNKIIINIVTTHYDGITEAISKNTHYNSTVLLARGGYTKEHRSMIMVVVPEQKVGQIIDIVQSIDKDAFITTTESNAVYGNFYVEPLK